MKTFYMTFGCGQALGGYALPLIANDENQARAYMHEEFNGKWCGTYSQEEWDAMKKMENRYWAMEKELKTVDVTWYEEKEKAHEDD